MWKSASAFDEKNLQRYVHRVCVDCIEKRACIECGVAKVQEEFTPREWLETTKLLTGRKQGRCRACMARNRPQPVLRQCVGECQEMKPQSEFTTREWEEAGKRLSGRQQGRCKACMARNRLQKVCSMCGKSKEESEYKSKREYMKSDKGRVCNECNAKRREKVCSICGKSKDESEYKSKKEYMKSDEDRVCKECNGKRRGF